jgi:hypothetical protein
MMRNDDILTTLKNHEIKNEITFYYVARVVVDFSAVISIKKFSFWLLSSETL